MKSKSAFTKQDLIVTLGCVIFLLANIAAIGSGGRKRAKEAVCLSNLRRWAACYQMYVNDNNGSLPRGDNGGNNPERLWVYSLQPYYKDGKIRLCPEATKPYFLPTTETGGVRVPGSGPGKQPFASYGPLWGVGACSWGDDPELTWEDYTGPEWTEKVWDGSEADNYLSYGASEFCWADSSLRYGTPNVKGADKVPLHLDCSFHCGSPFEWDNPPEIETDTWWGGSSNDEMKRFCLNRHNGAINGLFLDFSARKIGLKELWMLKWHRQWEQEREGWDGPSPWSPKGGVQPEDWPVWMKNFKDYTMEDY